jgi:hypothetical protein
MGTGALVIAFLRTPFAQEDKPVMPVPASIHIVGEVRRDVQQLLRTSPTFRAQWERLATTPGLLVRMRISAQLDGTRMRGRTVITRLGNGRLLAMVELAPGIRRTEWIAHEFEHVIEQIEGVELAALADRGAGVWRSAERTFETRRAIRAGRRVVIETRAPAIARSDNFVE